MFIFIDDISDQLSIRLMSWVFNKKKWYIVFQYIIVFLFLRLRKYIFKLSTCAFFCGLWPVWPAEKCELRRLIPFVVSNQLIKPKLVDGIHKDQFNLLKMLDSHSNPSDLSTAVCSCSQELGNILQESTQRYGKYSKNNPTKMYTLLSGFW